MTEMQAKVIMHVLNFFSFLILHLFFTTFNLKVEWSAKGYPSGVYFYRIEAGEFNATRKLLLLR